MDREPKLPTPQIDPAEVAAAILDAAENPARDVTVGSMAKLNTTVAKLMPAVGDRLAAAQADRQQYAEPPRNPEGALFRPSGGGATHGQHGPEAGARG
jgi:hypothetical protein